MKITAETPVWTVEQARAYNAAHPERDWCSHAHENFPYRFEGEGLASKAYCAVCGERALGVAAERDFRPNGYMAADSARMALPSTIAALRHHAHREAAKRVKTDLLGRRRILQGATYSRCW